MNSKNRFVLINLMAIEFVLLNLVLVGYLYFRLPNFSFTDFYFVKHLMKLCVVCNLSWLFIILYIRDSEFYFNANHHYFKSVLTSFFFFVGFVTIVLFFLRMEHFTRSTFIVPIFIFSFITLISTKSLIQFLRKRGRHLFSNTLLIGANYEGEKLKRFKGTMSQFGFNLVGYLNGKNETVTNNLNLEVFGVLEDLPKTLSKYPIDEIFIAMSSLESEKIAETVEIADNYGIRVKLIPENPLRLSKNYKAVTMGEFAIFRLRQSPLDNFSFTILKRLFDFLFALCVTILCAPIFLIIAVVIFIDNPGPIFYTPHRKGEANKTFKCYKFRTMSVCEDVVNGTKSTEVNDPRLTRVGKILRKADLDELPQFFNVLKGDMSVIGPRPHRIHLQNDFRSCVNNYMVRSYVRPGITGWAQVNGWRGPTKTEEQKNERVQHDLWYIENWSLWLDIKIVFLTVFGGHHKKAF